MAVLPPALHKLLPVRRIGLRPIQPAVFSFPVRSFALQVTEMSVGSLASALQPDDARLHHHTAHSLGASMLH